MENKEWIVKHPEEEENGIKIREIGDDLIIATYGVAGGDVEFETIRISKGIDTNSLIKYLKEANVFKKDRM